MKGRRENQTEFLAGNFKTKLKTQKKNLSVTLGYPCKHISNLRGLGPFSQRQNGSTCSQLFLPSVRSTFGTGGEQLRPYTERALVAILTLFPIAISLATKFPTKHAGLNHLSHWAMEGRWAVVMDHMATIQLITCVWVKWGHHPKPKLWGNLVPLKGSFLGWLHAELFVVLQSCWISKLDVPLINNIK